MGLVSRGRNRPSGNARNRQETTKPPASGGAYRAGEAPVAWRRRWGLALRKWFPARYGEPGREALRDYYALPSSSASSASTSTKSVSSPPGTIA